MDISTLDISTDIAWYFLIGSGASLLIACCVGTGYAYRQWRHRRRLRKDETRAYFQESLNTAEVAVVQLHNAKEANQWARENARITRFGDRRYRSSRLPQIVPPPEVYPVS